MFRRLGTSSWKTLKNILTHNTTKRNLFIKTESTPNENALKFIPTTKKKILPDHSLEFRNAREALLKSPLAADLFQIEGVSGVFFGSDFISVNKLDKYSWEHLKPAIFSSIFEYISNDKPILKEVSENYKHEDTHKSKEEESSTLDQNNEIVQMINEVLDSRIRPAVQSDGGDVQLISFHEEDGIVKLSLRGACRGCSMSSLTLKNGIENMLMHYIPEVRGVQQVDDDSVTESKEYFEKIEREKHQK